MYTAIGETLSFLNSIGNARIETRVRSLAASLKTGITASVEGAELVTPEDPEMSGGVVVFTVDGWDHESVFEDLYHTYQISGAQIGPERLRLCPHVYNTMADVAQVIDVLAAI